MQYKGNKKNKKMTVKISSVDTIGGKRRSQKWTLYNNELTKTAKTNYFNFNEIHQFDFGQFEPNAKNELFISLQINNGTHLHNNKLRNIVKVYDNSGYFSIEGILEEELKAEQINGKIFKLNLAQDYKSSKSSVISRSMSFGNKESASKFLRTSSSLSNASSSSNNSDRGSSKIEKLIKANEDIKLKICIYQEAKCSKCKDVYLKKDNAYKDDNDVYYCKNHQKDNGARQLDLQESCIDLVNPYLHHGENEEEFKKNIYKINCAIKNEVIQTESKVALIDVNELNQIQIASNGRQITPRRLSFSLDTPQNPSMPSSSKRINGRQDSSDEERSDDEEEDDNDSDEDRIIHRGNNRTTPVQSKNKNGNIQFTPQPIRGNPSSSLPHTQKPHPHHPNFNPSIGSQNSRSHSPRIPIDTNHPVHPNNMSGRQPNGIPSMPTIQMPDSQQQRMNSGNPRQSLPPGHTPMMPRMPTQPLPPSTNSASGRVLTHEQMQQMQNGGKKQHNNFGNGLTKENMMHLAQMKNRGLNPQENNPQSHSGGFPSQSTHGAHFGSPAQISVNVGYHGQHNRGIYNNQNDGQPMRSHVPPTVGYPMNEMTAMSTMQRPVSYPNSISGNSIQGQNGTENATNNPQYYSGNVSSQSTNDGMYGSSTPYYTNGGVYSHENYENYHPTRTPPAPPPGEYVHPTHTWKGDGTPSIFPVGGYTNNCENDGTCSIM